MTLSTPLLYSVDAFDPAYEHTFEFSYSGNQAVSNRAIITDNETQEQIYNVNQNGLKLAHVLPAGTLEVGHSYLIQIQVYDANGNMSDLSDAVLFYCFTTPQFYFENLSDGDKISSANLTLVLSYSQAENEPLNEYKYYFYDMTHELIYTSDSYYTEENMTHTIYGLKTDCVYYVQAIGQTTHGMHLDTGILELIVNYHKTTGNMALKVANDPSSSCVVIKSNIIDIKHTLDNENYTIENGIVNLNDNTLTYEIVVEDDFCTVIKAKQLPNGKFFWTTDGNISLSTICIANQYYARLVIQDGDMHYDILKSILESVRSVMDSDDNIVLDSIDNNIYIHNGDSYTTNYIIVISVYRKNNVYDLKISYE